MTVNEELEPDEDWHPPAEDEEDWEPDDDWFDAPEARALIEFEANAHVNGGTTWSARWFATLLGYANYESLVRGPVERAIATCTRLGVPVQENFQQVTSSVDGRSVRDMQLSRFACFLVAMAADSKKPEVAEAQVYLASIADAVQDYVNQVERVAIRGELSDGEASLSAAIHRSGAERYAFVHSEGYRGMYNMPLSKLKDIKRVPNGRSVLDFMDSTELAANLFRITQTRDKLINENVRGQLAAERTAHQVGVTVRQTIITLSNTPPELLPPAGDIREARSSLKRTHRTMKRIDEMKRVGPPGATE